jgi:hypothetical protein
MDDLTGDLGELFVAEFRVSLWGGHEETVQEQADGRGQSQDSCVRIELMELLVTGNNLRTNNQSPQRRMGVVCDIHTPRHVIVETERSVDHNRSGEQESGGR